MGKITKEQVEPTPPEVILGEQNIDTYKLKTGEEGDPAPEINLGEQNIDNYSLATGEAPVEAPVEVVDEVVAVCLDDELDAAKTENPQTGTVEYELNYAIERFHGSQDKSAAVADLSYRLGCLHIDARGDTAMKIGAIIKKIKLG